MSIPNLKKNKKPLSKLDTRELPQPDKETSIETYLFGKRLDAFLQDQKQDKYIHFHNFYSVVVLEVLSKVIRQERETNSIHIENKEVKLFLIAGDDDYSFKNIL